ncbi:allantoinase AllB [Fodinicola acaciae]|uniref:allantoinase AllB n=1 Tax=Fodinicola acaciae TaxID=2681555 RepID=UPI0013D62CD5|nr:allantoinase AllB [Fodinicola acaciae]
MADLDLVVRARRAIVDGVERDCTLGVRDGVIVAMSAGLTADSVLELANDEILLPGLVDSHVHVNDPGRTSWEGFATATRAAAAGGVTTIIDMPLNSIPPTVDMPALKEKQRTAGPQVYVDVGFWGGAVPSSLGRLEELHRAGVFGFKSFLLDSGVEEFPALTPAQFAAALEELRGPDALMLVHAEDSEIIASARQPSGARYDDFLASRPESAEIMAIEGVIEAARRTGARVHVLHLASASALPLIAEAKRDGVRLTVETCPHYLSFCAEEIPDGATRYKCCPPIRSAMNREMLWRGLADGVIDCVVSDHSPATADLKVPDFGAAWGGISGLQVGLSAVWTQARPRGFSLADAVDWLAAGPARIAGLQRKGRLAIGCDADFVVFAPDDARVVDARQLHHRNKVSAYDGRALAGVVRQTWLRGRAVTGESADGILLARGDR